MAEVQTIYVRAGDTEPLEIAVDATGLDDLTGLASAVLYMRKTTATTNHVDGATVTVPDTAVKQVRFDPDSNGPGGADAFAIGDEGTYRGYVKITWSDGDVTRHPGDPGEDLRILVSQGLEPAP